MTSDTNPNLVILDQIVRRKVVLIEAAKSIKSDPHWERKMMQLMAPGIFGDVVRRYQAAVDLQRHDAETRELMASEMEAA